MNPDVMIYSFHYSFNMLLLFCFTDTMRFIVIAPLVAVLDLFIVTNRFSSVRCLYSCAQSGATDLNVYQYCDENQESYAKSS